MATLHPDPYPLPPLADTAAHDAEFDRLQKISDTLDPGEHVGALLSWPVADGMACYLVTSTTPLTVQHVPHWDAWTAPAALIRGLTTADIDEQLNRRAAYRALLARHGH